MSKNIDLRIEIAAAEALVDWKSLFANEVVSRAKRLAAESSHPELVTLTQYRQAAENAVAALAAAIRNGGPARDDPQAA